MDNSTLLQKPFARQAATWGERCFLAVLFVGIGSLIYLVFSPYRPMLESESRAADYLGRLALIGLLLAAVAFARKSPRLQPFRPVLIGLLIMAVAVTLDYITAIFFLKHLMIDTGVPSGLAMQKLNQCFIVVSVVVGLTLLSGGTPGSIYLQKGNGKLGLRIGLITFSLAAAGATAMSADLFKGRDLTLERIIPWLPWLLIFVLANAAQEELLFRGLFLRKLQPFFGSFIANLLIVIVFTMLHYGVSYTSDGAKFLVVLFPLGLAWGYITQRTGAIWASILFHAGMDVPILLGIFSNLP